MSNTQDFSEFGQIEIAEAGKLLTAYASRNFNSEKDDLGNGIKVEFNPTSGLVFLVDEDYNVAVLTDDNKLENFFCCGNCGLEGNRSDIADEMADDSTCKECNKDD